MSCRQQRPWRSLFQFLSLTENSFLGDFPCIHLCLCLISSVGHSPGSGDPAASGEGEVLSGPTVHWLNLKRHRLRDLKKAIMPTARRQSPGSFCAPWCPDTPLYLWRQSWPLMFQMTWCWILSPLDESGPPPRSTCPQGFGPRGLRVNSFIPFTMWSFGWGQKRRLSFPEIV